MPNIEKFTRMDYVFRNLPLFICLCFFLIVRVNTVVIDNEVETQPRVYCFQNGLKLQVDTKNPFTGHIYVKGMYGNPQCNRNFTGETKQPALNVAYAECIHNREPLLTGGMMFTLEVIVQFHPYFTTKIDRAFIVSCSYREGTNIVTQNQILQGNVMLPEGSSDSIPITRINYSPLMPNCQYTIHRGSPDGPLISFARVGEKVVHKWQCLPTADGEFHGLLVHNCFARDLRGVNRIQMLDKRGCTLDPFSLGTPTYTLDLTMAYAAVHAFKFADDLQISFACSISLCLRMNDGCVGIAPPQCGDSTATTQSSGAGYGQTPSAESAQPSAGGGYPSPPVNSNYAESSPPGRVPKPPGYAFQKSSHVETINYPDSLLNETSFDDFMLNNYSLPEPPSANIFLESSYKSRKPELLVEHELVIHDGRRSNDQEQNKSLSFEVDLELSMNKSTTPTTTTTRKLTPPSTQATPTSVETSTNRNLHITASIDIHSTTEKLIIGGGTTDASLGIFVGEGVINVQPLTIIPDTQQNPHSQSSYKMQIYQPDHSAPVNSPLINDLQSTAFTNSKQRDAKPVSHIIRSAGKFKKRRTTIGHQATTVGSEFEYDDSLIQSSIDVTAQDFVVFDRRNGFDNETWYDDSEFISRTRHDICITTLAFTQIIIALTIFFATLMALAVFLHMRQRKKGVISDMHYFN